VIVVACSHNQLGNSSEITYVSVGMILTFWQLDI